MDWITNKFKQQSSQSSNNPNKNDVEPYIGPRPFDRNDKDKKRFFGRDYEADEIISLILGHRLVLVYAQSGAGKTSILNAKISPMLEEDMVFKSCLLQELEIFLIVRIIHLLKWLSIPLILKIHICLMLFKVF